jgi:uncharacterized membrane protein YidH (DUF202 family)
MTPPNDPRVYLASERTLLAWVRTGVAVIGLGFVVAKFALLFGVSNVGAGIPETVRAMAIGVVFVLLGGVPSRWRRGNTSGSAGGWGLTNSPPKGRNVSRPCSR